MRPDLKPRPNKKKPVAAIAAAAAAVVVIIGVAVGIGVSRHTAGGPTPGGSEPPAVTQPAESLDPEDYYTLTSQWPSALPREFLDALADDSVKAIRVGPDMRFDLNEPVEITKPVMLEENSGLYFNQPVSVLADLTVNEGAEIDFRSDTTVSAALTFAPGCQSWFNGSSLTVTETGRIAVAEGGDLGAWGCREIAIDGGRLEVDGHFGTSALLRTLNGGKIAMGQNGWADLSALWLESPGDLNNSDRINMDRNAFLVASEDVFEDAAHVSTFQELERALDDRLVPTVVVDGSFEVEYYLGVTKPMLVSEGVELSGSSRDDQGLLIGDLLVNSGRITCHVQTESAVGGSGICINYGEIDSSLYSDGGGCLLNYGDLNIQYTQWKYSAIVNLGTMRHETHHQDGWEYMDLVGGCVINLGEFTLASGNSIRLIGGAFWTNIVNGGTMTVEQGAELSNSSHISGPITLAGHLDNSGGILEIETPDWLTLDGGAIDGGLIQCSEAGVLLENNENIHSAVLTRREGDMVYQDVASSDALLTAIDSAPGGIRVSAGSHIVLDGPVTVPRSLQIENGASLTVNGELIMDNSTLYNWGDLTVGGLTIQGNAQLQNNGGVTVAGGGTFALNGGTAVLWGSVTSPDGGGTLQLDGGSMLVNWGDLNGFSHITVDGGSYLADAASMNLPNGTDLRVNNGVFSRRNRLVLNDSEIYVGHDGHVDSSGGIELWQTPLINEGTFGAGCADFITHTCDITNRGQMWIASWDWQTVSTDGILENRGNLSLNCSARINWIRNYGEIGITSPVTILGEIENSGRIVLSQEGAIQGNVSGRQPEHE